MCYQQRKSKLGEVPTKVELVIGIQREVVLICHTNGVPVPELGVCVISEWYRFLQKVGGDDKSAKWQSLIYEECAAKGVIGWMHGNPTRLPWMIAH